MIQEYTESLNAAEHSLVCVFHSWSLCFYTEPALGTKITLSVFSYFSHLQERQNVGQSRKYMDVNSGFILITKRWTADTYIYRAWRLQLIMSEWA